MAFVKVDLISTVLYSKQKSSLVQKRKVPKSSGHTVMFDATLLYIKYTIYISEVSAHWYLLITFLIECCKTFRSEDVLFSFLWGFSKSEHGTL
jgi:hypothetical protein